MIEAQAVDTKSCIVELAIDTNPHSFSNNDQQQVRSAINRILNAGCKIRDCFRESDTVRLRVALDDQHAQRLVNAVRSGSLNDWGVAEAAIVDNGSNPAPTSQAHRDELDPDEITQWMMRLNDPDDGSDEQAAQVIWDHYYSKMVRVAKKKMTAMPKAACDEEDVAISAMKSFMQRASSGKFDLKNRSELWRLLATITGRKASAERRRQGATKRGKSGKPVQSTNQHAVNPVDEVVDDHQMPELIQDVLNSCEELLATLDDEQLKRTAIMKMQGSSIREISDALDCSHDQTKYRLKQIRRHWRRHYNVD